MDLSTQVHATTALSLGKDSRYLFSRALGGPHSRSERLGVEKDLLPLPRIELRFLGCSSGDLVIIPSVR
jgi:hypothetical protein